MKKRKTVKQVLSGLLAGVTMLSSILSPVTMTVYAATVDDVVPIYEQVKDQLDADEVVTAVDYEVEVGQEVNLETDFTGMTIADESKVKVTYQEAKNDKGEDFTTSHADTYNAVYYVKPMNPIHPMYQLSRKIIVKEVEKISISKDNNAEENASSQHSEEETTSEEDAESQTEVYFIGNTESETDEVESKTTEISEEMTSKEQSTQQEQPSGDYMVKVEQGEEFNLTFNHENQSYDAGEMVTFSAELPEDSQISVAALKEESMQKEDTNDLLYSEVSYDSAKDTFQFEMPAEDISLNVVAEQILGTMLAANKTSDDDSWLDATEVDANSYYYYSDGKVHKFDSVMGKGGNDTYKYVRYKVDGKTYTVQAYCMQHSKPSPASGTTYKTMVELDEKGDDTYLRKAFFYGYGGPGWGHTFNGYNIEEIMTKAGCKNEMRAMQHYLVDYLYDGEKGFGGNLSTKAKNMLKEIKSALGKMPDPATAQLQPSLSTATKTNETETFTWYANEAFTITIHLENGVSLVNETTGKTSTGNVTIKGHEKFHLKATTADISKLKGEYKITSNFPLDFHAMLLKLSKSQDIGFGYYTDSPNLALNVTWADKAGINLIKKATSNGKVLAGAVYGVYSDKECKNLIKKMPATDAKGASSVSLTKTQDTVYLKEITAPKGYRLDTTAHNVKLVVGESAKVTLTDEEEEAKLKIVKTDAETGKNILIAGAEFKVYDMTNKKYVEQNGQTSYTTNEEGYLVLPKTLPMGKYRIEEVNAPAGYVLSDESVEVTVSAGTMNRDNTVEIVYTDDAVKGKIFIHKTGELLDSYSEKQFIYKERLLSGAVFEILAAENIYTSDFQKDSNGNRKIQYTKGSVVTTVTTNEVGEAVAENLPLGKYLVKEKTAPNGFVLNTVQQEIELKYENQNTPVVEDVCKFYNERQKVKLMVEKQDAENAKTLAGAAFALYNKKDMLKDQEVVVPANTLLEEVYVGEDGTATFNTDLPFGEYYIKETEAPVGYVLSKEALDVEIKAGDQTVTSVSFKAVMKNEPTKVEITKADATTSVELDGASLSVLGKDGNVVDEWISKKEEPHIIKRLHVGETYVLRETIAPNGYLLSTTDVTFTVEDTGKVQKVEMKDEVPTALLMINKKGEFLNQVTLLDNVKGKVQHFFEYISGNLKEVTFEIYAAEDIKNADGVTKDYYKADELVATITTNDAGIAQAENLPVGKYYVKEKQTAQGYLLDKETRQVDLSYKDQNTPVVTFEEEWQNIRQKVKVTVHKKQKDSERYLADTMFGLYSREDIKSEVNGEVLMKADTLIESGYTDENGAFVFTANLPLGGKYYVKELEATKGFVTSFEEKDFVFESNDDTTAETSYEFTFENEPTTVEITKSDLTTGGELEGAHLKVTDESGNVVEEWTSTKEPHVMKELEVGKKYTLTETKPADGYVTAESIDFIIENDAKVQKVEMKDDVTKLEISKTDITDSAEVPGAKLTILDEEDQVVDSWTSTDKPHYIEKLPIGKYTLREEQAPKGYIISNEDVTFEVTDTPEIQKVSMKNEKAKGKVIINKTDKDTNKPLAGVEFELRGEDGNVVETLTTDNAGHAESELVEIATFENGEYKESLKYILVETKALDGYELDNTEHEVVFEYVDENTPVIEVSFDLENKKKEEPKKPETPESNKGNKTSGNRNAGSSGSQQAGSNPKTGDTNNLVIPGMLFVAAFSTFVTLWMKRRKKK